MLCRYCRYAVFTILGVAFTCFLAPRAESAAVRRCSAFVAGHTRVPVKTGESQLIMLMANTDDENDGTSRARVETTRRECVKNSFLQTTRVMGIATTAPWNKISVAKAATVTPTEHMAAVSKSRLCDPAVSSWKKQERTMHIVGTAHISSVSADLAGNVVREVHPDCLFIELDFKRIERAFRGGRPIPGLQLAFWDAEGNLRVGVTVSRPEPNPFLSWLEQGVYQQIQREGFLAGEEFINSVQEASNIGAVVVLGDRDFGVSMRRLAEASKKTDIRNIIEADRVMTEMMKEEMPEIRLWGKSKNPSKEDVRGFIETLKTKEMVDRLMTTFKSFAPEIYTAMVKERDEYMSIGLDDLSPFETVVAVMGLAHVDGVTRNLEAMGWRRIRQRAC